MENDKFIKEDENYGILVAILQNHLGQTQNSMSKMLNIERGEYLQILYSKDFGNLNYKLLFALYYLGDQISKNKYLEYSWIPFYAKAVRDKSKEQLDALNKEEMNIELLYIKYYLNEEYLKQKDIKSHIENNQNDVLEDIENFTNSIDDKHLLIRKREK